MPGLWHAILQRVQEMQDFIKKTVVDDQRLPVEHNDMNLLPTERFAQLEIPVANFDET